MDKKISIIAKALERIPNSEELLLRYLSIMAGVCDSETILTLFRRALQCSPKSLRIHLLRLRFVLSSFELFSLYTVETICREAFDSLYPNNFAHGLYFLTLLVRILFQSGRNEKALGIYQAVVEYFCFRIDIRNDLPVDLDRIRTFGVRDLFILFWKSLSSRIGQEPRHNWTDWLVTFLKTTEKHYEQIRKLEYDSDSSGNDSSFSSSLESPAKLPSVENREESEEEWMDSDTSSTTEVMETSPIRNEKERELDFALVSRPVEREFKEWLYEEQLECSRPSFESCGLQHILQQEVDSPHNSVGILVVFGFFRVDSKCFRGCCRVSLSSTGYS